MDHRQLAHASLEQLIARLKAQPGTPPALVEECEALARAIAAFHMEGIRFRMYNVDRLLRRSETPQPDEVRALFAEVRRALEAGGFHTRSHQAPG